MSETLKVVCTPIGNLGDLSPRAAAALKAAAIILAEDTRTSRPLLDHVGTGARLVSCHQHNEESRVGLVVEALEAGESVCVISDAGAPGISDPGGRLVEAVANAGFGVEVIPGPSAVVAALMGAGLVAHHFAFVGFLPKKSSAKARVVKGARAAGLAVVLYEAPTRIAATLDELYRICGPERVVVARELTKRFETFHRGRLGQELEPPLVEKGEMVVVIEAPSEDVADPVSPPSDIAARLEALNVDESLTPRRRAQVLAREFGLSTKDAYDLVSGKRAPPSSSPAPEPDVDDEDSAEAGPSVARLKANLGDAVRTLLALDAARPDDTSATAAAERGSSGDSDVDALLGWLGRRCLLPAPVEARGLGQALLGALHAAHELEEALELMEDAEQRRTRLNGQGAPPDDESR